MRKTLSVGVLGHVDSGKTTLCKALSSVASTASFDKHPESMRRGITIDLGFSSFMISSENIQVALVDCPGHASLIRTIVGGSQIIDAMFLVVDAKKGIETQTAESIVLAGVIKKPVIIIINKVDVLDAKKKVARLEKLIKRLKKISPRIVALSAQNLLPEDSNSINKHLIEVYKKLSRPDPTKEEFLFVFDHCFKIKGKGTVITGTILSGIIKVGETVFVSSDLNAPCKVKSIQIFKKDTDEARRGDRVGILFARFPKKVERGYATKDESILKTVEKIIIKVNFIKFFKHSLKTRKAIYLFLGHHTCSGVPVYFDKDFNYLEEVDRKTKGDVYAVVTMETKMVLFENIVCLAARLDSSFEKNSCRFAFSGDILDRDINSRHII